MKTLCQHASPWLAVLLIMAGCSGDLGDVDTDASTAFPKSVASIIQAPAEQRPAEELELLPLNTEVSAAVAEPSPEAPKLIDGSDIVLQRILEQLEELNQTPLKTVRSEAANTTQPKAVNP